MIFFLLINAEMPTILGILTLMRKKISWSAELSLQKKYIYNLGARLQVRVTDAEVALAMERDETQTAYIEIQMVQKKMHIMEQQLTEERRAKEEALTRYDSKSYLICKVIPRFFLLVKQNLFYIWRCWKILSCPWAGTAHTRR